jgi:phospholipase/carboxylesterase
MAIMTSGLDGPRLPAARGRADSLVVLLHGYGADGRDLIDLGEAWRDVLPSTAFFSPHAPEPCGMAPVGRQWFPLTFADPHERWRGVVGARPVLEAALDAELARLGLPPERLALVGFSQGTMMALHTGLRRLAGPAAILGYSGELVGPERLAAEATAAPPILLVHGDQDDVIPVRALFAACEALAAAGRPSQFHLSPGLGHGIDEEGLRQGGLFLARALATGR